LDPETKKVRLSLRAKEVSEPNIFTYLYLFIQL